MANTLTVSLTALHSDSAPDDENLCRISGYLRNVRGQPIAKAPLRFASRETQVSAYGSTLVLPNRVEVTTDATGFLQVDLLRGAEIVVSLPTISAGITRTVPDQASINLVAWLFPYVESIAYDGDNPLTVSRSAGGVPLVFTATLSDGSTVELLDAVTLETSDEGVLTVVDQLVSMAGTGSATITPTGVDYTRLPTNQFPDLAESVARHIAPPDPALPDPISITVTE